MLPPPDAPGHHHMARGCQIMVKVLPHLDKPNAEWLRHVLALDSGWPHYQIADHLTAALASVNIDHQVTGAAVSRHRSGECSCRQAGLV